MWCGVGVMLITLAISWLIKYDQGNSYIFGLAGLIAAMPIHHFGFLKLADKNIQRIDNKEEIQPIFSFITWKSYLTIIFMVALGITLRHSSMPKHYLAIIYIGMGLGLFLSGLRYIRISLKKMITK